MLCLIAMPYLVLAQADLQSAIEEAKNAGIDASTVEEIRKRAQENGLDANQVVGLLRPSTDLARQNLPSEALVKKTLEGLSKNVPANRIASVLQDMGNATRESAPLVNNWMSNTQIGKKIKASDMSGNKFQNEMIVSVARGIRKGVPEGEITTLLNELSASDNLQNTSLQSIPAGVHIFSELPTTAESPEMSRSFIVRSLKSGFSSSDIQKLPAAISVAQQRSQLPAASVVEGVANQLKNGVPAGQILKNLFNGNIGGGPPGNTPKGLDRAGKGGKSG